MIIAESQEAITEEREENMKVGERPKILAIKNKNNEIANIITQLY